MSLTNFHTHTKYCDGKSTCEEVILSAIDKKMSAIGFSGHGYTFFDHSCCMMDTAKYIEELKALREKYKDQIAIYIGVEEDSCDLCNRDDFDYIIGSSHYIKVGDEFISNDQNIQSPVRCLEAFDNDFVHLSEVFYSRFCDYVLSRKPDIIGHFDIITKYDELGESHFLGKKEYERIAEKYIAIAAESGSIFEINTGAISRGYRKTPYPAPNLLKVLKDLNARVILSSDSHSAETLVSGFAEARELLRSVGITNIVTSPFECGN